MQQTGENGPLLTSKQVKLIVLLCHLDTAENFPGIMMDFLEFVNWSVFGRSCIHHYKMFQLANISRFYVAICRVKGQSVLVFWWFLKAIAALWTRFNDGLDCRFRFSSF